MALIGGCKCFCGERNCDCDFSGSTFWDPKGTKGSTNESVERVLKSADAIPTVNRAELESVLKDSWVHYVDAWADSGMALPSVKVVMNFEHLQAAAKKFGYRLVRE